jgi:hypothetical protein
VPAQRTAVFAGGPAAPPPGGFGAPPPGATAPAPRRRGLVVTATVAVVALIAAGIGAYFWISRTTGGAESPTAAVQLLAADLTAKRYLDAVGRLHPGEADLFRDAGDVVVAELERLEVLRPEAEPAALSGQLEVRDLRFSETPRMVRDNVAIIDLVGGVVTISADPSAIPFTDSFAELAFPDGPPPAGQPTEIDIARVVAQQGEPLRVASVEVDGGWYVSLFYTVADYALERENLAWPATSVVPRGAATPNDALRETVGQRAPRRERPAAGRARPARRAVRPAQRRAGPRRAGRCPADRRAGRRARDHRDRRPRRHRAGDLAGGRRGA